MSAIPSKLLDLDKGDDGPKPRNEQTWGRRNHSRDVWRSIPPTMMMTERGERTQGFQIDERGGGLHPKDSENLKPGNNKG